MLRLFASRHGVFTCAIRRSSSTPPRADVSFDGLMGKLHNASTTPSDEKPPTPPLNTKPNQRRRGSPNVTPNFTLDSLLVDRKEAQTIPAPSLLSHAPRQTATPTPKRGSGAIKPHFSLDLLAPLSKSKPIIAEEKTKIDQPKKSLDTDRQFLKEPKSNVNTTPRKVTESTPEQTPSQDNTSETPDIGIAPNVDTLVVEEFDEASDRMHKKRNKREDERSAKNAKPDKKHISDKDKKSASSKDFVSKKEREKKKVIEPKDILLPDGITVVNMGSLLGISFEKLASKMNELGFEYPTPDFVLNTDVSSLIALEFGMNPIIRQASAVETKFKPRPPPEDWSSYPFRPPVVTIMGHVDHGKTTLLDTLRKTSVAAGEAGGITQHIGAFFVTLPSGKKITFLDTPGHAAFSAMRERGARVTDIVVLVVAADDGVMPQTIEALKFAQEAGVQIVVAVNKCDKHGATPSKVKENLIRYGLLVEDYGGEVPAVEVSGLTGLGLDQLEETIVAVSEMADIRGDATGPVEATVIESRVVKGKGNVTTMLVTRGTLKSGQILVAGTSWCKVRTLTDERGKAIKEAGPSSPVEISGWKELPDAGDFTLEAENENQAKEVIASRIEDKKRQDSMKSIEEMNAIRLKARAMEQAKASGQVDEEAPVVEESTAIPYPIVLKTDVHGSSEALEGALEGFPKHEIRIDIISAGVGQVTDSDVELAYAANARIIAFNVPVDKKVMTLAQKRKVPIDSYNIIYKLMDDLQEKLLDTLPKEEFTIVLGEADVLQMFELNTKSKEPERIAGCRIMSGKVVRNESIRVIREEQVVFEGKLKAFKHHKKDIMEASKGLECGMAFDGFNEALAGDRVVCFRIDKKRRTKLNYQ
ncbi:hypothetical protein CcCBS67573_g07317 [Chytriomyces confervae]|uniref:Translation initiation factor IF-2, mitochondrial n=1 Tax=Chytriomyces confervae TaxID=246404 RepID=A0A507EVA2_9FUNG|nr:hypothetical protein HDU80_006341 [Chytriomyces hyalinus]TPX68009.1 hypothetical protein CcCBS67573_g07317 [Chytriomyces confervae]